jgi:hypothetical protein
MKWTLTQVSVTVLSGAATGSSAANTALALNNSRIIGLFPTGVATSTGWGLVETVTLGSNGAVTVTTRANVATADLTVTVVIATPANS